MSAAPAPLEVSAVLPAYEEAEVLDWVLERAIQALDAVCSRWEIVLVVHLSARDGTPARADSWALREPRVRVVVQHAGARAYGRALALGIAAARMEWIFLCDADAQFDPLEFPRLAGAVQGADLVAGVRHPRADPWPRIVAARLYNLLLRWLLGARLRDTDCAFKLVRRAALGTGLRFDHLADAELVARVLGRGGRCREVEVPHRPRRAGRSQAEGRLGLPRAGLVAAVLREMVLLRRELRLGRAAGSAPQRRLRP